ncbi:MAG: hypothetical protein NTZ83_00835 [Candidatus Pacearchaeota archaeon]|nr:hypothetical protein [Candidatus Pacearchaeota archaeon]
MGEEKNFFNLNEIIKEDDDGKIRNDLAERVTEEINEENKLFDKSAYEYGKTWSILGSQVVGGEYR